VMRTARDQDDPKSRLEAPPMQCPRCETRPLADLYVRRDHSPVPSPSLVRSEKQRAPKCRVQAFTSRTNHLNCCRNNTVNSHHLEYFGASPAGSGECQLAREPLPEVREPSGANALNRLAARASALLTICPAPATRYGYSPSI
jgi:hypothetical protein